MIHNTQKSSIDYAKERNILIDQFTDLIENILGVEYSMLFSVELEFYLLKNIKNNINLCEIDLCEDNLLSSDDFDFFCANVTRKMENYKISSIENEDEICQFEVRFEKYDNPISISDAIVRFKKFAIEVAAGMGICCTFKTKPFKNKAASSMHINFSIFKKHRNVFYDENKNYSLSDLCRFCIGGLIRFAPIYTYLMQPTENCYERIKKPSANQIQIHHPTQINWGLNNRTAMIRIPRGYVNNSFLLRIEHRLPSAMSNPYKAMFAISIAIKFGINEKIEPDEMVFGNSFDLIYRNGKSIPRSLQDAKKLFDNSVFDIV